MSQIDRLKRLVETAMKADRPRRDVVDRLLYHIVEGDSAGFVDAYDREQPSSGEMLRVISRYGRALRDLRTK
ncbi:MAG: hypothetical protein HKM95_05315 [Inquilinus sp.]|nr:hypothetical protein [Inquilinus sp.]